MSTVTLRGVLVCADESQVAIIEEHLSGHIALSREEPGCLSFEVQRTSDPLVWQVDETYADSASFRAHQARVATSEWGMASALIQRRYEITGLADDE